MGIKGHWALLREAIYRFFMVESSLEPRLQLLSQIIENIVYVTIINRINYAQLLGPFSQNAFVLLGLIKLCLIKYCCRTALRFGVTLIFLQLIMQQSTGWIITLAVSQFIGSISFDYSSKTIHSESRNQNKLLRMVLLMGNVAFLTLVPNAKFIHIASSILFLVLFVSKERSLMKSQAYREISLRFCLWAACEHLRIFLISFIPLFSSGALISFLISQAIFSLFSFLKGKVNFHQLLAKEERLKLAFLLLRYIHASDYDAELQAFAASFVAEGDLEGEGQRLNNGAQYSAKALTRAVLSLLNRADGPLAAILRAQVQAQAGKLLTALEGLVLARERLEDCSFLHKVLLLRAEEQLALRFTHMTEGVVTLAHQKEWTAHLDFEELLHKATIHHLKLCLYLKKPEVQLAIIKNMCARIIAVDAEVTQKFEGVRTGFISSTQLCIGFLIKVRGDFEGAEAVLNRQRLRERQLLDGHLEEKLFIRLRLAPEGLQIDRVGYNTHSLLNLGRNDLQGQSIQRLVPTFFRSQHQKVSTAFVQDSFQRVLLFQKRTVVLNGRGTYNMCGIILKLGFRQDGFCFEGHLRISPSDKYDFDSYFITDQRGAVLQSADGLFDDDLQRNSLKIEQLFQQAVGQPLVRISKDQLYETFDPVLAFSGEIPFYFYARKIQQIHDYPQREATNLSNFNEISPALQARKESIKQYLSREKQLETNIKSKQVYLLFSITLFFLLCLFGSECLMITSAQVKYNNQNFAVVNFINLIQYYSVSVKLEINFIYIDLRDNYNYSNTFFKLETEKNAQKLQTVNENLKLFNLGKYKLPTYNPAITYQQSNYEIVIMLFTNSYLYRKFANDTFMSKIITDQAKLLIPVYAIQSITDYRISIFSLATYFVQDDIYYEHLSLGVSLANILIFILIAGRLFWKLRQIEEYALKQRCVGPFHLKKIRQIAEFMKEITHEEIPIHKMDEQLHIYDNFNQLAEPNNTYLQSEASLIKESSVRNIMNDSLNKTGFIEDMERMDKAKSEVESSRAFRKANTHRYVLIAFGVFMALLVILDVANEVINYQVKNVDQVASLNSVLNLYKANGYYSSRAIVMTFNTMLQKVEKGVDSSAAYYPVVNAVYAYLNSFTLPLFPQTQFNEFSNFSSILTNLYQSEICTYMTCDPQYYDELKLNFISVIKKYAMNISTMVKATSNMTQSQFTTYIASNKRYIDMLFYTEMILRGFITDLMMNYLNSYKVFMTNLYNSKLAYIYAMIAITAVGVLAFLYFIWHIRKEQQMLIRMLKIYRDPKGEQ